MTKKHQIHNLIILDESGSMESIKKTIIQGFNELVQTIQGIEKQFPEQEHFISLLSFNGFGHKWLHFMDSASNLTQINDKNYNPAALTPLFDALGVGIGKLRQELQNQNDFNVLVTILTDGAENDSKEYAAIDIKKIIETLKKERWTFTYIGTDHDVEKIAVSISINNTLVFEKNEEEINKMFVREQNARSNYSKRISRNEDTSSDYYKAEEQD